MSKKKKSKLIGIAMTICIILMVFIGIAGGIYLAFQLKQNDTVLGTNFNDIIVYKTTCDRVYDGSPNIQKCVDVARKECPSLKIIKSGWEKNTYPGYNSGGYFYEILYECPESY